MALDPSALKAFDADWYARTYPDLAAVGAHAWEHFRRWGWREGRLPGPWFDPHWYDRQYRPGQDQTGSEIAGPNLPGRGQPVAAFAHYACGGMAAGHWPNREWKAQSGADLRAPRSFAEVAELRAATRARAARQVAELPLESLPWLAEQPATREQVRQILIGRTCEF